MRTLPFILGIIAITFLSCSKKKEEETNTKEKINTEEVKNQVTLGKKLFNDRTCTTCHSINSDSLGPSLKKIAKTYRENNKDIVTFLKGKQHSIVEKDSNQVAVMKTNIEDFIKNLNDKELQAISAYIKSVSN